MRAGLLSGLFLGRWLLTVQRPDRQDRCQIRQLKLADRLLGTAETRHHDWFGCRLYREGRVIAAGICSSLWPNEARARASPN